MHYFQVITRKILLFLLSLTVLFPNTAVLAYEEAINIEVTIFYMDGCVACREDERLREIFIEQLPDDFDRSVFTMTFYNTFQMSGNARFNEILEEFERDRHNTNLPLTIIGVELFFGEAGIGEAALYLPLKYAQLREGSGGCQENEALDERQEVEDEEAQPLGITFAPLDKLMIRYYSTEACPACEVVSAFLEQLLAYTIVDGIQYPILIEEISILEDDNWQELFGLFEFFQLPERAQVVPIVFVGKNVLSGDREIVNELEAVLQEEDSRYKIVFPPPDTEEFALGAHRIGAIMLAGLVNGLGPCSLSMMLLFLSLIAVIKDKNRFRLLGLGFIGGRVITYLIIGLLVGGMLATLPFDTFTLLRRIMSVVLIGLCLLLAAGNFLDIYYIRKQEYGKIKVRIPQKLRILNEALMKKAVQPKFGRWLLVVVVGVSAVLALGEFFCAGQIYLAMILSIMQQGGTLPFLFFVLYIVMLCIPGLLLLILVDRGKRVFDLSEKSLQAMPIIKLVSGLFFVILAVVTLLLL